MGDCAVSSMYCGIVCIFSRLKLDSIDPELRVARSPGDYVAFVLGTALFHTDNVSDRVRTFSVSDTYQSKSAIQLRDNIQGRDLAEWRGLAFPVLGCCLHNIGFYFCDR